MIYALDPGHGEDTLGKRSPQVPPGVREFESNRDIARRVHAIIVRTQHIAGSCILVRERKSVPLKERVRRVNKLENACLVSIHANASGSNGWTKASGSRVFVPKMPEGDKTRAQKSLSLGLFIDTEFGENENIPYGVRKLKEAGFYMLRCPKCPAVLVECGFMTNKGDASFMASEYGRQEIAKTIARAIIKFEKESK